MSGLGRSGSWESDHLIGLCRFPGVAQSTQPAYDWVTPWAVYAHSLGRRLTSLLVYRRWLLPFRRMDDTRSNVLPTICTECPFDITSDHVNAFTSKVGMYKSVEIWSDMIRSKVMA